MAGDYLREMRAVQPAGPYFLGGWSMGGVVAFEMARQLEAEGERVALLALFDAHAPTRSRYTVEDADLLLGFARDLELDLTGLDLDALGVTLASLAPAERLSHVLAAAKEARVLPPDVDIARFGRLFEVFRSNARAMQAYAPKPFGGPITLFRASRQAAAASRSLGWGRWARGGVEIVEVPGDHHGIVRPPHVATLAAELGSRIDIHLKPSKSEA
jgi:thioesterase domain-containing protein